MNKKALNKIGRVTFLSFVIISVLLIGNVLAVDWWPTFGHDYQNRGNTSLIINISEFGISWVHEPTNSIFSSPVIDNLRIYYGGSNMVEAINITNGVRMWSISTGTVQSAPTIEEGILYYATNAGQVNARNATNGDVIWQEEMTTGIKSGITIVENKIYFTDTTTGLFALNKTDGTYLWNYTFEKFNATQNTFTTTPAYNGEMLYVGGNNTVYSINSTDG